MTERPDGAQAADRLVDRVFAPAPGCPLLHPHLGPHLPQPAPAAAPAADRRHCATCGTRRLWIEGPRPPVYVCGCWTAYSRADLGDLWMGTAYCVDTRCDCRPAGRSAAHGALTGRARWRLAHTRDQAAATAVTLCGGCYRRVSVVVPTAHDRKTQHEQGGTPQ